MKAFLQNLSVISTVLTFTVFWQSARGENYLKKE